MKKIHFFVACLVIALILFRQTGFSQDRGDPHFVCIVLGSAGGLTGDNLSSYLLAPSGSDIFICLDAGTVYPGIVKAYSSGSFKGIPIPSDTDRTPEGWILQNSIRDYLITHAHLDHIAGMIMASADDSPKDIYASPVTLTYLRNDIFNWQIWPDFGHEGNGYHLDKYSYHSLEEGQTSLLKETAMNVTAFTISHGEPYRSTAFLIESQGFYVLYIGDTGADEVEHTHHLDTLWTCVAPLIKTGRLLALFMEVSYPDGRPDDQLFGHLTPSWHMQELNALAVKVDTEDNMKALARLTVVVTGIKPSLKRDLDTQEVILKELNALNDLGVSFIIPYQGMKIQF